MTSPKIIPVVLCGGAGTRLWPASRESRPKQFIPLVGTRSTFQEAVLGVTAPEVFGRPIIVANQAHRFMISEQLEELGVEADILLEPARRDSGPAIAAAARFALERDEGAIVLTIPADHMVRRPEAFRSACMAAVAAAAEGKIVVFGATPHGPETAYGYIRPGAANGGAVRDVAAFVEKPDAATAEIYVREGYLWNSGNFLFGARSLLEDYAEFEPASAAAVEEAVLKKSRDLDFCILDKDTFLRATPKSIDYAVMERTAKAAVVPVDHGWSDLGTWSAIWEAGDKDDAGNVARGQVEILDGRNNVAISEKALVAISGLDDVVVVANDDAILVARRGDADGIRKMVGHLRGKGYAQADSHSRGYRPWGFYQSLDHGGRFQVKRIVVKPGGTLSLQMHYHRSEHWVVVRGTAEVTVGNEKRILAENESTYIPQGALHRLRNPGKIDLELIEVQTGSYLGEDDIERFDDIYGR